MRPLNELIDHLVARFHRPLEGQLALLDALAGRAAQAHPQDSGVTELVGLYRALRDELVFHMAKEERVLFPWIRSGRGASAGAPVQVMNLEHRDALEALDRLKALGDAAHDCDACRELVAEIRSFDGTLREHIRLEEQVLFPRALAGY